MIKSHNKLQGQVEILERQLEIQRRISFAAGLFQGNVTVRTLIESFAEAFLVVDESGTIILTNQRFEKVFGYPTIEIVGQDLTAILPERFRTAHRDHIKAFFAAPRMRAMGQGLQLAGQRRDGREFPVEVSLSHLETETGTMAMAFVTDITERVAAEKAILKQNQALDTFAQMVAHDLKSLITTINGFSELIKTSGSRLSDVEREPMLEAVIDAGHQMSDIISELLLLARVRREDVKTEPVEMGAVIGAALKRLQSKVEACGAQLRLPADLPIAMGHPRWLEEIWYNLASNALAYGGPTPVIELGHTRDNDTSATFWIKDQGPGLSEEQVRGIMEPVEGTSYSWVQGHGLGLTVVRNILEKLDSALLVSCIEGEGCTFSFQLPILLDLEE